MCSSLSFAFLSFLCQMSIGHNHPPFGFQHGCSLLYACWAVLLANVQTRSHVSVKSKKHFFQLKVRIEKNNPAMISNFPLYRPTALHPSRSDPSILTIHLPLLALNVLGRILFQLQHTLFFIQRLAVHSFHPIRSTLCPSNR